MAWLLKILRDGEQGEVVGRFERVYAILVPFFTVEDQIPLEELQTLWKGDSSSNLFLSIWTTQDVSRVFDHAWQTHGESVHVVEVTEISAALKENPGSIAILPFEQIQPRYKVLKLDGVSPLDKPMNVDGYGLTVTFGLLRIAESTSENLEMVEKELLNEIPKTNRDETRMTVLVMSGTTAITRGTAAKVILKGTSHPVEAVKPWFLGADLRHVSNEISFVANCPTPDPYSTSLRFCAQPDMLQVLEELGVNIVELTGNHENDYGAQNFANTLSLYEEKGWHVFGGGMNTEQAKSPLLLESNGNKLAFIGCNPAGPPNNWATEDQPGAALCDFEYLHRKIAELKLEGYIVITTFQHAEIYQYMYAERYREDFHNAIAAGADIVQGSQAHYPMGFELIGDQLIHYGLGNFLFDQMDYPVVGTRREFIDRHIFYDGKYLSTEILTALLTDWSRPVPMTLDERVDFLNDLFSVSIER